MPSPSSLSQFGSYHVGHSGLTTFSAHITGFPHDPGNNKIKYSYDATTHFVLGHTDAIQVNTSFKDSSGSSGSPWVQSETIVGNTGWLNGVSSMSNGKQDFSPRFIDRIYNLHTTAFADR